MGASMSGYTFIQQPNLIYLTPCVGTERCTRRKSGCEESSNTNTIPSDTELGVRCASQQLQLKVWILFMETS